MNAIQKALHHVQETYPDVELVVFGPDGRWQYMSVDFVAPKFGNDMINQSILEDAADSLDELPAIYVIDTYTND